MEAGLLTEYKRSKVLYDFYKANPELINATDKSHALVIKRQVGGQNLYDKRRLIAACCPCIAEQQYSYADSVLVALEGILEQAAMMNWGPTITSRFVYLWFHTVTSGYNWAMPTGRIEGIKDNWNWNTRHPASDSTSLFIWMNHLLAAIMPTFVPGYDSSFILENERAVLKIDASRQIELRNNVRQNMNWTGWLTAWNTWYSGRAGDGTTTAVIPPADSELPNGIFVLDVDDTIDPAVFPEPRKWTPLIVSGVKRNYLTYNWGNVSSSCLSNTDETVIQSVAASYFPNQIARDAEIAEIALLTGQLTDEQKCLAEFWAGGPFTASPPGALMWFWKEYMISNSVAKSCNMDSFFYSGFDLAQHLFEAGRVAWAIKKFYMQSRPIQDIRRLYRGVSLIKYDGTTISGDRWVPYQESNFVTPPFADFPSGHSTYSQVFASVMTDWFGYAIAPSPPRLMTDLHLLSPMFTADQMWNYATVQIPAGASRIQPSVVPAQSIVLHWSTWQELANSAGLSRKYGGIHAASAHAGGQAVANALHVRMRNAMGMRVGV